MLPDNLAVSADLLETLTRYKEALSRNGAVVHRRERDRRPSYRLRFRIRDAQGLVRHRSIPLASGDVVVAVRHLVSRWKQERQEQRRALQETQRQAKVQAQQRRLQHQQRRRMLMALAGGGRKRGRRVGREYDDACSNGSQAELKYVLAEQYRRPNRRRGRPRKSSLTLPMERGTA